MVDAQHVLDVAESQVGYSRWDDPEQGSKYGRWYAGKTGSAYFGASGVPFCAMGVSWALAEAGTSLLGDGRVYAYVPWMIRDASQVGRLTGFYDIQPGDVLCFDWDGDGVADHTGFALGREGEYVRTVEFNTSSGAGGSQSNGGGVYRRWRAHDDVCAVIRPAYDAGGVTAEGGLVADGWFGSATIRRLQEVLGTTIDGVVSSQPAEYRAENPALTSGWEWTEGDPEGSAVIEALQATLGGCEQDGLIGPETINRLEEHYGFEADGVLDGPSNTVIALQRALNNGAI